VIYDGCSGGTEGSLGQGNGKESPASSSSCGCKDVSERNVESNPPHVLHIVGRLLSPAWRDRPPHLTLLASGDGMCPTPSPPRDLLPKYMTPLEAEEVMRRLWRNEAALLRLIYAAELGKVIGGTGRADLLRAGETTDKPGREASDSKCSNEGYRMFFVRVLPVAPNKFRPPSKIGEEM